MADRGWNLEKEAHLLSGRERARLVIKDTHAKTYDDKNAIHNPAEKQALLHMPDHQVKEEYADLWDVYEKMPLTMSIVTKSYLSFKYLFESLKKAHLMLNLSPAVSCLSQLVKENISDEKVREAAAKIMDAMQVLEKDSLGKPAFKAALNFIKKIVPKASEQARDFITMKKVVDRINEDVGFNIFAYKYYSESCQVFIDEIIFCIREHNEIMKKAGEGMPDLDNYLILEPGCNEKTRDPQK